MRPRLTTAALTVAAAVAGTIGTRPDSDWYESLEQPDWQPPKAAFPLVWTPLYATIAWSTGRALAKAQERSAADGRRMLALTATDLAVNAGWCWVFFAKRSPGAGLAVIVGLDALNLALVREAGRHDRTAATTLLPYVAWTGFATALNAAVWRRNR